MTFIKAKPSPSIVFPFLCFFWSCLTKIYGGTPQACRSEHIMMICHMQMLKRSRTGLFWQISIEITQVLRKFFLFLPFSYYLSFAYYYSCIFFLNRKECRGFHPEIDSKKSSHILRRSQKLGKISKTKGQLISKCPRIWNGVEMGSNQRHPLMSLIH